MYAALIADGHQWHIQLSYNDGSTWDISGSNAYPQGWDELYDVLYALTGTNILSLRSDWLNKYLQ